MNNVPILNNTLHQRLKRGCSSCSPNNHLRYTVSVSHHHSLKPSNMVKKMVYTAYSRKECVICAALFHSIKTVLRNKHWDVAMTQTNKKPYLCIYKNSILTRCATTLTAYIHTI